MIMWFFLLLYIAHLEPVILQSTDTNRLILKNGKTSCEGHVELYHNGRRGYIGDTQWSRKTEEVVCRSTHCGEPVSSQDVLRRTDLPVWLNEMMCQGNEKQLWECDSPGWNTSYYAKDSMKMVKCSNKIEISLDRYKCAGAVQYFINGEKGYFCGDNWAQTEANHLCDSLRCGKAKSLEMEDIHWRDFQDSKKMMLKCSDIEELENLWQCATEEVMSCSKPATVICEGHKRLQLRKYEGTTNVCSGRLEKEENDDWKAVDTLVINNTCQQMYCGNEVSHSLNLTQLTCTDDVSVVLMDNNNKASKCYGAVHIKVNGTNQPVCGSGWTNKDAEVVCKELNCGTVVDHSNRGSQNVRGIMDSVSCSGKESSLWFCRAKREKTPFKCSSKAYVVCSDSVNVTLVDGPGECTGRVEIYYEGQWQRVTEQGWSNKNSDAVCTQLNCGKGRKSAQNDNISQGSGNFLAKAVECSTATSSISECIKASSNVQSREDKAVAITCEQRKVVVLEGLCSGKVGIEYGDKTYWLSGYSGNSSTWNNNTADTVCRQKHCGKASNWMSIPSADLTQDVWGKVYSCDNNSSSLFKCAASDLPSDYNKTVAHVTCTGKITMSLSEGCWGSVNICANGKCGGVCKDAWTTEQSLMLCKDLSCGDTIQKANNRPGKHNVIFKSVHKTKHGNKLSQCSLVERSEQDHTCDPAYIVCSGSIKSELSNDFRSVYNCSGNVEVRYEGQMLPVCKDALKDTTTQNAICEELNCGLADEVIPHFGLKSKTQSRSISKIECSPNAKSLTACNMTSTTGQCALGGLRCSKWKKMELKLSTKSCSGVVFVHSKAGKKAVSADGWTSAESRTLCQDLECGGFTIFPNRSSSDSSWDLSYFDSSFTCGDAKKPENIWSCENATSPSKKEQLYIECQDEPVITLSEGCRGEVRINNIGVCNTNWDINYSHKICQEMSCGNAVDFDPDVPSQDPKYHIRCEEHHNKLGQCSRYKGPCNKAVSVYCVKSIFFNTTEHCGGQIEVKYVNAKDPEKPQTLCEFQLGFEDKLCKQLQCGSYNRSLRLLNTSRRTKVNMKSKVKCEGAEVNDFNYCVGKTSCNAKPAEIYCNGYEPKKTDEQVKSTPIMPIIVGIALVLVLVILIIVFVRVRIMRKEKKVSSSMFSRNEVEFESGDYEDVTTKANEMEDFHRGRFGSEAQVIMESDARSASSFPYDDIDEAAEAQPLNSQAATAAGASGDSFFHDDALDQNADGVSYEVEDPQENYDDIEASPETTQTKAEVHASPQTTPESVPAASSVLVQGDDDYLVPGQDG